MEGRLEPANMVDLDALYRETTNGYLQAIGARLVAGRFFNDYDRPGCQPVSGEQEPWRTIVGVVADVRERGLLLPMKPAVYLSDCQLRRPDSNYLAIRTAGDPLAIVNAVRHAVWSVDSAQALSNVGTMRELMEGETSSRRQAMVLLSVFAGLALLLAALGIYGVLSYVVTQRTQEMGIRIALCAERARLIRMIVSQSLAVAALAVLIGVAAALALMTALAGLLYGVTASAPRRRHGPAPGASLRVRLGPRVLNWKLPWPCCRSSSRSTTKSPRFSRCMTVWRRCWNSCSGRTKSCS